MNDPLQDHAPSPEFVATLARDITRNFRHETQFAPSGAHRPHRLRTVFALAVGLVAGVATGFASTQVADARQREEIASTTGAKHELAVVQRDLARTNYEQVRRAFEQGVITEASRLSAEAELRASEARVARIEIDLAESRETAAPPRDELWAPVIDTRDFVRERLNLEAATARQRLTAVQASAAEAKRAFDAGVLARPVLGEAQSEVLQAKRNVDAVAQKLSLRKQFLDEHLPPREVARRLQRFELMTDVERAQQLLRLAEERLVLARERSGLGAASEIKVKKAEVAALEGSMEVEQLRLNSARTALTYREPPVQQPIPILDLSAPSARTPEPLRSVLGLREVPGGRVLVNDMGNRQLRLFDTTLSASIVVLDSTPGITNRYGARVPLIRYLGDSSLLPDIAYRAIRVLDGRGQVVRTVTLPDVRLNLSNQGYSDDQGRVLFTGASDVVLRPPMDSVPILRVDLESGTVDTVGRVRSRPIASSIWVDGQSFEFSVRRPNDWSNSLVPLRDDWAVLSDGLLALVRGNDYHIDWIRSDGATRTGGKLPFDWQRLATEAQRLDSVAARARTMTWGAGDRSSGGGQRGAGGGGTVGGQRGDGEGGARGGRGGGGRPGTMTVNPALPDSLRFSRLGYPATVYKAQPIIQLQMPNVVSTLPDADGNLWILPTGSALTQNGQPVYDVVNARNVLFQRVRIPAGRSLVGFGPGGVVYLASSSREGLYLERTRVVGGGR